VLSPKPFGADLVTDAHACIFGATGSGKTTYANQILRAWKGPALAINTQGEPLFGAKVSLSMRDDELVSLLRKGHKLNLEPPPDDNQARLILDALIPRLIGRAVWKPRLLLLVDEAHVYAPNGKGSPLQLIARRGRKWGVCGLWISQRPADLSKTLVTQAGQVAIFETMWETTYFRSYGLDVDEIKRRIEAGGPYSYVVWHGSRLEGPYKESLT